MAMAEDGATPRVVSATPPEAVPAADAAPPEPAPPPAAKPPRRRRRLRRAGLFSVLLVALAFLGIGVAALAL